MFSLVLIWLIVAAYALAYIYVLYRAWTRVPRRDVFDVVPFLHPVDSSMVESLLDPATDYSLRWRLSPRAFREAQLRRMRVYCELVHRMSDNSAILAEFGRARFGSSDNSSPGHGSRLEEAHVAVQVYSSFASLKLRIWLSLPLDRFGIIPTPDLARLRKAGDLDGPKAYEELKTAAAEAFAQLKPDELEALTRNL
ncbi:MAG: hypothetical protein WAN65_31295 [Candidatus Sulfotelmatobacter sp.]